MNYVEELQRRIADVELKLQQYKSALAIIMEFDTVAGSNSINSGRDVTNTKPSYREVVLGYLNESPEGLTANQIMDLYSERYRVDKKKVRNSIYPTLTDLKKKNIIEAFKAEAGKNIDTYKIKKP